MNANSHRQLRRLGIGRLGFVERPLHARVEFLSPRARGAVLARRGSSVLRTGGRARGQCSHHLGLQQPFQPPPAQPWAAEGAGARSLSRVAIKITGACTLAHDPFPYPDIWDPLGRIFDAFGFDRCMWGTDWTRAVKLLTYKRGSRRSALQTGCPMAIAPS